LAKVVNKEEIIKKKKKKKEGVTDWLTD